MPATPDTTPLERAEAASQESLATMEAEAADYFASRDAERTAAALNPVAPALERATARSREPNLPSPGKAAAAPAPPSRGKQAASGSPTTSAKAPPTPESTAAKVPGAPRLVAPSEATRQPGTKEGVDASTTPPSTAPDISDLPVEYAPGKLRAPQWDKLRANRDHYEALATARESELAAARAELEQLRASSTSAAPTPDVTARLTALQSERDSLLSRLEAVAVEKSPRFEAQFKPRREAAFLQAKNAVGPSEAARVEALLALPESAYRDEQVEALLATLPPLRATKLTQAVADLDRLASERAALAAQGSELFKSWTAEEAAARERAASERLATATRTFDAEVDEWRAVGIITPEDIENARSVYSGKGSTLQDAARASLWAAAGPKLAQQAQDALNRVAELEGEVARLRGAQPGVGAAGSGALPSAVPDEDDPATTGYAERIAREAMRGGLRFGS